MLVVLLPETKPTTKQEGQPEPGSPRAKSARLKSLERLFAAFTFVWSGCEFTLTFLTFDLLAFTNKENGKLLGIIGLLSCLLQGGYVRRKSGIKGADFFVRLGLNACFCSLGLLAVLAKVSQQGSFITASTCLWGAAACMAVTTATVSTSLSTLASLECDEAEKGLLLGQFRSAGQVRSDLYAVVPS